MNAKPTNIVELVEELQRLLNTGKQNAHPSVFNRCVGLVQRYESYTLAVGLGAGFLVGVGLGVAACALWGIR